MIQLDAHTCTWWATIFCRHTSSFGNVALCYVVAICFGWRSRFNLSTSEKANHPIMFVTYAKMYTYVHAILCNYTNLGPRPSTYICRNILKPEWHKSSLFYESQRKITFPETNIAPENGWLEDDFPFWEGLLSGPTLVLGRVPNNKPIGIL